MTSHDLSTVKPGSATRLTATALGGLAERGDGTPIVLSKLRPPAERHGAVVRGELLDRVDDHTRTKLVLVVAPAGWGKTSLLGQWCSSQAIGSWAWLSADKGDNDPARFLAHLVAAVKGASTQASADATQLLTIPGAKVADVLLPRLINDLVRTSASITLLIDNYQLVSNTTVHECVDYLIEHLPPGVRLVLATRSEPALPLARLRARGEMTEIRADELRFSEDEAAELLNGTLDLGLPLEHVRIVQGRTEGWAAGLCLAGLSLRGAADPTQQVRALAGDSRPIADYLMAEVLDAQPAYIRSFLTRTAVLDRMCAGLCDAVTGAAQSQRTLEEIERSNLFVVPLDANRSWYRYHAMFADALRRELERSEPGLAPLLHHRASEWHRRHGTAADAVGHSIIASDLSCARDLVAAPWRGGFGDGLSETAESWLTSLSPEASSGDSRLRLIKAWLASHLGRLDDVEPWVGAAEAATLHGTFVEGPISIESASSILRAGTSLMLGDPAAAESASRRAVELEATGSRRWRFVALASLGASLHWLGEERGAIEVLSEVAEDLDPPTDTLATLWALGCLSAISLRGGDVDSCERYLHKAAGLVARHRLDDYREGATALLTLASLHESRGELREAEEAAISGLDIARLGNARLETVYALLCLARIKARAGLSGEAQASLSAAKDLMNRCATPGILPDLENSTERLAAQYAELPASNRERRSRTDGLTGRELEVFELLAAGKTNNEIAADLVVSVHTVERHLQNAYRKVGARNRGQAAAYFARTARLAASQMRQPLRGPRTGQQRRWLISRMASAQRAGRFLKVRCGVDERRACPIYPCADGGEVQVVRTPPPMAHAACRSQ
jgi:LuxR family transcriptional regulator, maltose regulon positive regulatory protein